MPLQELSRFGKRVLAGYGLVLAYQLFLPPVVGLADNGDYAAVTCSSSNRSTEVALAALAVLLAWRKRPELFPAVVTLAVMAAIELGLGALADVAETTRHLFLYLALMDLVAVAAVCLLALPGAGRRTPARAA